VNTHRLTSTLSLALALGLLGSVAISSADTVTTTKKATTYSGVVSEINPTTSTMIIKSDTAPAPRLASPRLGKCGGEPSPPPAGVFRPRRPTAT
jgi:hypothetical protein